jgi:hypothetical protein
MSDGKKYKVAHFGPDLDRLGDTKMDEQLVTIVEIVSHLFTILRGVGYVGMFIQSILSIDLRCKICRSQTTSGTMTWSDEDQYFRVSYGSSARRKAVEYVASSGLCTHGFKWGIFATCKDVAEALSHVFMGECLIGGVPPHMNTKELANALTMVKVIMTCRLGLTCALMLYGIKCFTITPFTS